MTIITFMIVHDLEHVKTNTHTRSKEDQVAIGLLLGLTVTIHRRAVQNNDWVTPNKSAIALRQHQRQVKFQWCCVLQLLRDNFCKCFAIF